MDNELRSTYDILERIGEGSGGVVYKAYHKRLRKTVVLKKIIDPGGELQKKRQEVDILKNVSHSYLPQVLDFIETEDGVFTVMNYIPGKSFQRLLNEGARFTREDLLKWALQICSALNYLHSREIPIIHGDIKPSNIMLRPDGDICLIDFNISFYLDENTVLGCTKGYTSPEQFWAVSSKQKQDDLRFVVDNKADIYSVGATLYHLATGNIRADYTHEIDIDRLTTYVGPRFAEVIAKATNLDPKRRYDSAAEMYRALQMVPEESREDLREERKGKGKIVALVACAVLAMCAACGGFIAYGKHQEAKYNDLVSEMKSDVIAGSFDDAEEKFDKACDIYDDEAEAYYWKDYILYCKGDLAGCASVIEDDIKNHDIKDKVEEDISVDRHKSLADLYCLRGTSLLEEGDTEGALQTFREVSDGYEDLMRADNYRDYAVALARDGQIDDAKEKLDRAKNYADDPLPEYSIAFTEGEIFRMEDNDAKALSSFDKVIDSLKNVDLGGTDVDTDKELMLYRSYMEKSRIYRRDKDYPSAIEVLLEAREVLGEARQAMINRELGSNYNDSGRYDEAAACYELAASSKGGIANDWYNYSIEQLNIADAATDPRVAGSAVKEARTGAERYKTLGGDEDFRYWAVLANAEAIYQLKCVRDADYDEFERLYGLAKAAHQQEGGRYQEMMDSLDRMNANVQRRKL